MPGFDRDWRARATCGGLDPDWFEAAAGPGTKLDADGQPRNPRGEFARHVRRAQQVCAVCPVRIDCLAEAVEKGWTGIWGGAVLRPDPRRWDLQRADDLARARGTLIALQLAALVA